MPFTFVENPLVWWPVKVRLPVDGGGSDVQTFDAQFLVVRKARFAELFSKGAGALLREVVRDWRGIQQTGDIPLPFSTRALDTLLDVSAIEIALAEAYAECTAGGARKN